MAGETRVTICGALTADPELRFTPSGKAVAGFTVASNPRTFDKASNAWKDGDPLFLRVNVWNKQAENIAESLRKGDRVVVTGALSQRAWEDREGNKRTAYEVLADEVGASLLFRTVKHASERSNSGHDSGQNVADPWAALSSNHSDECPF